MKPLVITIGCEYGARGNSIGKKIAEDLGIKFYGRDLVDEIISEVGIPNEIMDKVESGVTIAGKGVHGQERGDFSKYSSANTFQLVGFVDYYQYRLRFYPYFFEQNSSVHD